MRGREALHPVWKAVESCGTPLSKGSHSAFSGDPAFFLSLLSAVLPAKVVFVRQSAAAAF